MTDTKYIFPFTTCENPSFNGSQPISTLINILCVIILLIILINKKEINYVIITLILFELWHAFSHFHHIPGTIHMYIIHFLSYLITFTTLYYIYDKSKSKLQYISLLIILIIVIIDLIFLIYKKGYISVILGVFVFIVTILTHYNLLPRGIKENILIFIILIILGILLFINEVYNCEKMMKYAKLPYHALVEIIVSLFIILFAYKL